MRSLPVVTKVKVIPPYTLEVEFEDGFCRQVDMTDELWGEVFQPLKDPEFSPRCSSIKCGGRVAWPNGVDLAPEWLYEPDPEKYRKLTNGNV